MIPVFPHFKKLTLGDKEDIENIVKKYPPYSDYSSISLWNYNIQDKNEISLLNNNLVIKFHDYQTLEPFYSFLGNNEVKNTINTLLEHAKIEGITQELRLIPEIVVSTQDNIYNNYYLREDRDNFDYILSIDELTKLKGNKYGPKRNFINRFIKKHPDHVVTILNIKNPQVQQEIKILFCEWEKKQKRTRDETENELIALKRFLKSPTQVNLVSIGVYIDKTLVGFSINEIGHDQHGFLHFEKADIAYTGIFQYLKHVTALHLEKEGCLYINYQQDLGILGLRKAKQAWYPIRYLKKYTVAYKKDIKR